MSNSVGDQFKGLDMHQLIAGPLMAACEAQLMLAESTRKFIDEVGLENEHNRDVKLKTAAFSFERDILEKGGEPVGTETVNINVPVLSIVKIPTLGIDEVKITFDMEVKSAESSAPEQAFQKEGMTAKLDYGCFNTSVNITGKASCAERKTADADNSAKYHVSVHAKDFDEPEGLAKMLEMLSTASEPVSIVQVD